MHTMPGPEADPRTRGPFRPGGPNRTGSPRLLTRYSLDSRSVCSTIPLGYVSSKASIEPPSLRAYSVVRRGGDESFKTRRQ